MVGCVLAAEPLAGLFILGHVGLCPRVSGGLLSVFRYIVSMYIYNPVEAQQAAQNSP